MAPRSIGLDDDLSAYVPAHSTPPDEVRRQLIERTEALGDAAGMQIAPEQGEFLTMLTALLARLAPKGLICVDNTLWSGAVIDLDNHDTDTEAIRRFNDHVAADVRTRQVIVPIGDGLTLIRNA